MKIVFQESNNVVVVKLKLTLKVASVLHERCCGLDMV